MVFKIANFMVLYPKVMVSVFIKNVTYMALKNVNNETMNTNMKPACTIT